MMQRAVAVQFEGKRGYLLVDVWREPFLMVVCQDCAGAEITEVFSNVIKVGENVINPNK